MFQSLPALPADPILGLMASYRADSNPKKIDLGIGVYKNEAGDTPVMTAVKKAPMYLLFGLGQQTPSVGTFLAYSCGLDRVSVQH